jgi:hypothetical protein
VARSAIALSDAGGALEAVGATWTLEAEGAGGRFGLPRPGWFGG